MGPRRIRTIALLVSEFKELRALIARISLPQKKKIEKNNTRVRDTGSISLVFSPRKKHRGFDFLAPSGKATGG